MRALMQRFEAWLRRQYEQTFLADEFDLEEPAPTGDWSH